MAEEEVDKTHIRHCLLYEFDQGSSARAACHKIREIYGSNGLGETQCKIWFDRFRNGDRSLQDLPKSGRPSVVDNEVLRQLIESDPKGIVYWEVLDYGQTVDSIVYCQQLDRLAEALKRNRPELVNRKGVILLHDNARPHTSRVTQQKIRELGYEVLPHPAYSPDIAPSDYHLFRSLRHFLNGKIFADRDEIKSALDSFFAEKSTSFFMDGIKSLVNIWQMVVDNDGDYIID